MFEDTQLEWPLDSRQEWRSTILINPRHGLRAVYSEAIRSPDMFENNVNWSYRVTNLSSPAYGQSSGQYFVKTRGPGNLDKELMRSRELGYNGFFADLGLTMDVKLFYDEITDMIELAPAQQPVHRQQRQQFAVYRGRVAIRLADEQRRPPAADLCLRRRHHQQPSGQSPDGAQQWLRRLVARMGPRLVQRAVLLWR